MEVARAVQRHRVLDLRLEVVQVGDGRGRDVRNLVGHRDQRNVLALAEMVAGISVDRLRVGGARTGRRRTRALHAGVHVRLVVVTDVEHVVAALEHPREGAEADVDGAAVTTLGDDALVASLHPERRRDAGRHGGGVREERVDPRQLPRRLRVRRREDLEATGRVRRDQASVRLPASPRRARIGRRAPRRIPDRRGGRR